MITVLVTYKLPACMDRAAAAKLSEDAAARFQGLDGLNTKHFLYQECLYVLFVLMKREDMLTREEI